MYDALFDFLSTSEAIYDPLVVANTVFDEAAVHSKRETQITGTMMLHRKDERGCGGL